MVQAQCPQTMEAGVHVVQANQTLFSISKMHNISVDQLTVWNSITSQEVLKPCRELVVSAALENNAAAVGGAKQKGKWHTVRAGETVESLANLYGYTSVRFREFNKLEGWRRVKPGAILRSTDCACRTEPEFSGANEPAPTMASSGPMVGESFNEVPAPIASDRAYMKVSESSMIDEINRLRANPRAFITEVRAYVAKENAKPWRSRPIDARAVNSLISRLDGATPLSMLRAHPCLYRVAKTHGDYLYSAKRFDHADANGQYPWSRSLNACPTVKLGTTKDAQGFAVGNENLVAGHAPREAIISLLIDEGDIGNYGHRNALLAPEWKYATAYNFGEVNGIPNHFVQMFGR